MDHLRKKAKIFTACPVFYLSLLLAWNYQGLFAWLSEMSGHLVEVPGSSGILRRASKGGLSSE